MIGKSKEITKSRFFIKMLKYLLGSAYTVVWLKHYVAVVVVVAVAVVVVGSWLEPGRKSYFSIVAATVAAVTVAAAAVAASMQTF